MYINRLSNIRKEVEKKSCFLLGARQTGKTSLIQNQFNDCRIYNLLDSEIFLKLSQNPKRLEEEITDNRKIIVIDEIQKLPELLDTVHLIIEKYGINFLLTGSSARKLRRGGVNLLGGRARIRYLYPFVYRELGDKFNLARALNYGLIPSIYLSDDPQEDLGAYAGLYLREEVAAEGFARNMPAFSRFLSVAALSSGNMLNYAKISSDAQVPSSTVQEYFQILRDTQIGFDLKPWKETQKRKPVSTAKFYFFDNGILRYLQNRPFFNIESPETGYFFESFMANELRAYCSYSRRGDLFYWRSKSGYEVDFIINGATAVEVKASKNISGRDLRGIKALMEENNLKNYVIVSLESEKRRVEGIKILPWKYFLSVLWKKGHEDL